MAKHSFLIPVAGQGGRRLCACATLAKQDSAATSSHRFVEFIKAYLSGSGEDARLLPSRLKICGSARPSSRNIAPVDGLLRQLKASVRRPNIFGDVSWCRARVADKRVEEDAHLVDLELWVDNPLGETTAKGIAMVGLPSRTV